jgi:hypothetical protein
MTLCTVLGASVNPAEVICAPNATPSLVWNKAPWDGRLVTVAVQGGEATVAWKVTRRATPFAMPLTDTSNGNNLPDAGVAQLEPP